MTFHYFEPITSRLPLKIKIDELDLRNNIDEAILIRLLSGTIDFNNFELNTKRIKQRVNYFKFTYVNNHSRVSARVLSDINSAFTNDSINNYFLYSQNKVFFKELVHDLAASIYFKEMKSYTTAFIHIYRFIEYMSITFPLFYSSIANDYYKSFSELKALFNDNGNASGLNFNKVFFRKLFDISDPTIPYNNSITIDFSFLDNSAFDSIKKAFLVVIQSEKSLIPSDFDFSNKNITFKFSYMHDLIIIFRNRFFHYMPTQKNISTTYFVSEIFFKEFNEYALNWIAYLFYEITEKRISKLI